MKSKSKSSRVADCFGLIEPLESRIAPAAATPVALPANPTYVTATVGGALLMKAGEVLTTGAAGGGSYLLYVAQGQVLVHTTDLNHNDQLDFNEITGLSVGAGAVIVSFVDIHGDVVTDLNPDGTLSNGGKGDILLDNNIVEIDLRSLNTGDFAGTSTQTPTQLVNAHLAMSNYSIFGNIYAGGGFGLPNDPASGLAIDISGESLQTVKFPLFTGTDYYQAVEPVIGSIYVGSSASGHAFTFGSSGNPSTSANHAIGDVFGNLLAFNPATGEAGASIYNIGTATPGTPFSIGTIHAGDGGFNGPGGSIVNVSLSGDNAGTYKLIAGNAGPGTVGQSGGSIINFSESGAFISEVILQSGNGGSGLTGAGGNAGQINLNPAMPIAVNAHFVLNYGSGGSGYTQGGAGGGTTLGVFDTPAGTTTIPQNLVSTMHVPGSIGSTTSFDFNGDGFSDAVYSTLNPNQVVVAFGNYTGQFGLDSTQYIYLNAPAQVDSIVVGNFTGTKNPITGQPELDIAVACGSAQYAGIEVYLSQYNPKTGAFEGFSDPLFTPLPSLAPYFYSYTSTPITKLVAGDFAGNGVLGLAVVADYTFADGPVDPVILFLNGETNSTHPGGSGYFYANFNNGNQPFFDLYPLTAGTATNSIFEATALKTFTPNVPGHVSNGNDVLVEAGLGAKAFNIIENTTGTPFITGGGAFGKVDTNRKVGPKNIALAAFTPLGIAVTEDPTNHNIADIAVLSASPVGFLELFKGDGTAAGFNLQTGNGVDQAGIDFGASTSNPAAIVAVPNKAGTAYSDVAVLDYTTPGADLIYVLNVTTAAGTGLLTGAESATEQWFTIFPRTRNPSVVAFDTYDPHPVTNASIPGSGPFQFGFLTGNPLTSYPDFQEIGISQPLTGSFIGIGGYTTAPLKVAGYFFNGGAGGSSESGVAGAGGSFGQSLTVSGTGVNTTAVGSLSVVYPTNIDYEGEVIFTAGNGGNGFNGAGAGGNLNGVSVTYAPGVETLSSAAVLVAGNGGQSLTGGGGAGGSISQVYIQTGFNFLAGNGGVGLVGGSGGALFGNTQANLNTATTNDLIAFITLVAGNGASGILGGGSGGNINSFVTEFLPLIGGVGGSLSYTAGTAGNAVAGPGGSGGSIINCSPNSVDNNLAGPINLQAGSGGSGLSGGVGGAVTNFYQVNSIKDVPTSFTILSGFGGNATVGTGGAGGSISGISIAASDVGQFSRMVAGAGGSSNGGAGGAGGSIAQINTTTVAANAQDVVAAGAGGAGLTAGGAGGNVTSSQADSGSYTGGGKVLVIAGDGGSSSSAAPFLIPVPKTPSAATIAAETANDKQIFYAVGGVSGPGGTGGSILQFTQPLGTGTDVDLIAGNGGATINHSAADQNSILVGKTWVDNSGVGGSIENIGIAGNIGNCASGVAIKSYNNIFAGQTMQEFIDTTILGTITGTLNDSVGNVGLVVGAAGRVEGGIPSSNGINGTVYNVHAENIMSMVAGNVDQADFIQSLTDYGVTITKGFSERIKRCFTIQSRMRTTRLSAE